MKVEENILRAVACRDKAAIWWKDGGLDVKIDNQWYTRWGDKGYVWSGDERSQWLETIQKKELPVREE